MVGTVELPLEAWSEEEKKGLNMKLKEVPRGMTHHLCYSKGCADKARLGHVSFASRAV